MTTATSNQRSATSTTTTIDIVENCYFIIIRCRSPFQPAYTLPVHSAHLFHPPNINFVTLPIKITCPPFLFIICHLLVLTLHHIFSHYYLTFLSFYLALRYLYHFQPILSHPSNIIFVTLPIKITSALFIYILSLTRLTVRTSSPVSLPYLSVILPHSTLLTYHPHLTLS